MSIEDTQEEQPNLEDGLLIIKKKARTTKGKPKRTPKKVVKKTVGEPKEEPVVKTLDFKEQMEQTRDLLKRDLITQIEETEAVRKDIGLMPEEPVENKPVTNPEKETVPSELEKYLNNTTDRLALKKAELAEQTDKTATAITLSDRAALSNIDDIVVDIGSIVEEPIEANKIETSVEPPVEPPMVVNNNINNGNIGNDGTFSLGPPRSSTRTTFKHGGMIHNQE